VAALSLPQNRFVSDRAHGLLGALRLDSFPDEAARVEQVLAPARIGVALFCLIAFNVNPTRYPAPAHALIVAYLGQSLALALLLRAKHGLRTEPLVAVHLLDLTWAAAISLVTDGPNSPFFGLFVFSILAAAYRWGLRATLTTAVLAIAVLFGQVLLVTLGGTAGGRFLDRPVEFDLVITRCSYVLIGALLLGYMAETEKELRAESTAAARLIGKVRAEVGMPGTLQEVSRDLLGLFDAERLLLVMYGTRTGRLFFWEATQGAPPADLSNRTAELDPAQRGMYLFRASSDAWAAVRRRGDSSFRVMAVDGEGRRLRNPSCAWPAHFLEAYPFRSLVAVSLTFREEWEDRLFLLDPARTGLREIRFLRTLVRQVGPAIYNVYLLSRLRARVGAIERARMARDLHDGVIQSLIGLETQIAALRRETGSAPPQVCARLAEIQELVRQEVAGLRELLLRMKPLGLDPRRLPEYLVDLVDRFHRETGIAAHFFCELDEVALRPRVCTELARIVQEALANVRKHSGARKVVVRFDGSDGQWKLTIDDDGEGFGFSGRLSLAELDAARLGPLVIKERVRSIGGDLSIDSAPGGGALLEITVPRVARG